MCSWPAASNARQVGCAAVQTSTHPDRRTFRLTTNYALPVLVDSNEVTLSLFRCCDLKGERSAGTTGTSQTLLLFLPPSPSERAPPVPDS